MRKGFVLTMDAMLALIVATLFLTMTLYLVSAREHENDQYLYILSQDLLTVADKMGYLSQAADSDSTNMSDWLDAMPENICVNATIVDEEENVVWEKATCEAPATYVLGRRAVTSGGKNYVSTARVWYK